MAERLYKGDGEHYEEPSEEEEWRVAPGFPDYEVSSLGRVRRKTGGARVRAGRVLKPRPSAKGYLQVFLRRGGKTHSVYIHRLVAEAFLGPAPPGHECDHIDGDKADNRACNLRWATRQENMAHAWDMGLCRVPDPPRGEQSKRSKLTERDVAEVFRLNAAGMTQEAIARRFGIAQAHVSAILRGKAWGHLTSRLMRVHEPLRCIRRGEEIHRAKLNESLVREIRKLAGAGISQRRIAKQLRVSSSTVCYVLNGRTWRHVE